MDQEPLICGFNNKHYDNHIIKAILCDADPPMVKEINDFIIVHGHNGWENPFLQQFKVFFDTFDLMDDCQMGLSLKAITAHMICSASLGEWGSGERICQNAADGMNNRSFPCCDLRCP